MVTDGNKYFKRSRISEGRFRHLVRYFALDLSATEAARLTGLTRKTVTTIFLKIRRRIAEQCGRKTPFVTGQIRIDESRSCVVCVCGQRGCGFLNRTPAFALLSYDGRVYTEMIPDCRKPMVRALIHGRAVLGGVGELNGWHGFDGLVDANYRKPFKVKRRVNDARQMLQTPGGDVETFWDFARRRLEKFYGVSNRTFYLHLKECEWRYNLHDRDPYPELLRLLRKHPI